MQNSALKDKFYELTVVSKSSCELLRDLVFSFGITCIEEIKDGFIIRDENELDEIEFGLKEFAKKLEELGRNVDLEINLQTKENKDWINEYKRNIKPILIDKIYIHPSWKEPKDGFTNIIIDPALAFGSGHHESTNACVGFLQKYAKSDMKAIDVGCGSGILSIVMAKLGCSVDACDTDEQAVDSSKQNADLNGVKINKIWTGSISNLDEKYDVVVANIIADVILILKNDLIKLLQNGSYLILAGVLDRYKERILDAFSLLKLVESKSENEWSSFVFQK
ncbi:50S ribosomal protein L11 methyltransferase [Campylobacter sp. RM16188]|uniref:50S ribosomal protein L11 methyltransferase n=1 Tax=Campylobacter sp. RM16188 TaxID=1705725 RepID=UPI001556236F|nr:50S ribosomal protein L11 methyltransferase [Campylobacter sp. RM16188]